MRTSTAPSSKVLIRALRDKEDGIREAAAGTLGNIGPDAKKAVPALTKKTKDREPSVGLKAKEALGKIQGARLAADDEVTLTTGSTWKRAEVEDVRKKLVEMLFKGTPEEILALHRLHGEGPGFPQGYL